MTTAAERQKQAVGRYAAGLVHDGMVVGLGTGSTVRYLLEALGERIAEGDLRNVLGIPTSDDTTGRARSLGIRLTDLSMNPEIDLALDGADEVDPSLDLIKGLGGALLREKVVAAASNRFIAMVDGTKRVPRLGTKAPLPVEIDEFSLGMQLPFLENLGARPRLRSGDDEPFRTDGGNLIIDCYFDDGIPDPRNLAAALDGRPGIFEHGLFLGMASTVLVATDHRVEVLQRESGR